MQLKSKVLTMVTTVALVSSVGVGAVKAETITAGGASFPLNIIEECRSSFPTNKRFNPQGHSVDYSSVGSGSGRSGFFRGQYIFGMTDALVSARDAGRRDTGTYKFIPLIGGAIGVAYRVDGVSQQLKMSQATIAKIFAGQITKWNAAEIRTDNPGVRLPNLNIVVYYRSDSSGTTENFVNYLKAVAPTIWTKSTSGVFSSAFPGTVPTNGSFQAAGQNTGVANGVADRNGAITYAEVSFIDERAAEGKNIKAALVRNGAGEFVAPTSRTAAAFINASSMSNSTGVVRFNYTTTRRGVYPITAISYAMANTRQGSGTPAQNAIAKAFIEFFLTECAPAKAAGLGYTALTGARQRAALRLAAGIGG